MSAVLRTPGRAALLKLYAGLVWGLVAIGIVVLLAGCDQPIIPLVNSAVTGGL